MHMHELPFLTLNPNSVNYQYDG